MNISITGGKLNAESTIAAIMENEAAAAIVEKYLPGFATNEQVKAAYSITFGALAPMLGLPTEAIEDLLRELNEL